MLRILTPLLLTAALAAGCTGSPVGGETADEGTVIHSISVAPGRAGSVALPTGRLDLTLGAAADAAYDRGDKVGAPQGGSFVPVGWNWEVTDQIPGVVTDRAEEPVPRVELVVGSERYDLADAIVRDRSEGEDGSPLEYFGTAWVAVPQAADSDEVKEATVAVTYDGLEQVMDPDDRVVDHGRARDLYLPVGQGRQFYTATCGEVIPGRGFSAEGGSAHCSVDVIRTPWFQPVGWSPDENSWTVLRVRATAGSSVRRTGAETQVYFFDDDASRKPVYRLDGRKPVKVIAPTDDPGQWDDGNSLGDTVVFPSGDGSGELVVSADFSATQNPGGSTPAVRVPMAWKTYLY